MSGKLMVFLQLLSGGEMWKSSEPASMGAQVSGASLMEGIARLE